MPGARYGFRKGGLAIAAALLGCSLVAYFVGSSLAFAGLAILGVGTAVFALLPSKNTSHQSQVPKLDDLNTPGKTRLKPVVKLREDIVGLIASHEDNPVISAMAMDTQEEVDSIVVRSCEILDAKKKVQKLASGVFRSRAAVSDLQTKLANENDSEVQKSIESALAARKAELQTLEELELTQKRLEANLDEAESTLAQLKSQILRAVAESSDAKAEEEIDPFSEMTRRLRRLSSTMEESIETVSGKNWA